MPLCEQCGVDFEAKAPAAGELTSLRVLCPTCTQDRLRRKQAAAAAATASARPAGAAPAAGKTAAGSTGATRPAAPAAAPGAARPAAPSAAPGATRSANPAPARTTTTAAPGPRPASPARPAAAPAAKPAAAPAATSPAARPAASSPARPAASAPAKPAAPPARSPARSSSKGPKLRPRSEPSRQYEVVEAGTGEKPMMDKATKIGAYVAGGLLVGSIIVVILVMQHRESEEFKMKERVRLRTEFITALKALDINDPDQAAKVRPMAIENADKWQGNDYATEVNTLIAKADAVLQNNQDKLAFIQRLAGIEAELAQEGTLTPPQIGERRRSLNSMLGQSRDFGPELETRVATNLTNASRLFLARLLDDGRRYAEEHPEEPRQALTKLALAEEEARTQYAAAKSKKDTDTAEKVDVVFRQIITEQDALTKTAFTDAYIASVPWRDLIAPGEKSKWKISTLAGFSASFEDGKLILQGPSPEAKGQAIMSIGDDDKWRDFVLECDFKMVTGSASLFFRLGKTVDKTVEDLLIESQEEDSGLGIAQGKTYHLTVRFIGSNLAILTPAEEEGELPPQERTSGVFMSRAGALGIAVPKGAKLEISKLRIKVLR